MCETVQLTPSERMKHFIEGIERNARLIEEMHEEMKAIDDEMKRSCEILMIGSNSECYQRCKELLGKSDNKVPDDK